MCLILVLHCLNAKQTIFTYTFFICLWCLLFISMYEWTCFNNAAHTQWRNQNLSLLTFITTMNMNEHRGQMFQSKAAELQHPDRPDELACRYTPLTSKENVWKTKGWPYPSPPTPKPLHICNILWLISLSS